MESRSVENQDQLSPREREETVSSESNNPEEKRTVFFQTKSLAEVYAQQGHVSIALEIYRRMQERNPSDQQVGQRISELESRVRSRRPARPKDQHE